MTTDTEALREQFEAWATTAYGLSFDDDTPLKRYLWVAYWVAYHAGYAAAKANTGTEDTTKLVINKGTSNV